MPRSGPWPAFLLHRRSNWEPICSLDDYSVCVISVRAVTLLRFFEFVATPLGA